MAIAATGATVPLAQLTQVEMQQAGGDTSMVDIKELLLCSYMQCSERGLYYSASWYVLCVLLYLVDRVCMTIDNTCLLIVSNVYVYDNYDDHASNY